MKGAAGGGCGLVVGGLEVPSPLEGVVILIGVVGVVVGFAARESHQRQEGDEQKQSSPTNMGAKLVR